MTLNVKMMKDAADRLLMTNKYGRRPDKKFLEVINQKLDSMRVQT